MDGADKIISFWKQILQEKMKSFSSYFSMVVIVIALSCSVLYTTLLFFYSLVDIINVISDVRIRAFISSTLSNFTKIAIFSSFVMVCYSFLFKKDNSKKRWQVFTIVLTVTNMLPALFVLVYIINKTIGINLAYPWLYGTALVKYWDWFTIYPEADFWYRIALTGTTSVIISYISLCACSDRYCIPFPEKIKKYWLKINLALFWVLFLSYPVLYSYFTYYQCESHCYLENVPSRTLSHSTGIYGLLTDEKIECKRRKSYNNCL